MGYAGSGLVRCRAVYGLDNQKPHFKPFCMRQGPTVAFPNATNAYWYQALRSQCISTDEERHCS